MRKALYVIVTVVVSAMVFGIYYTVKNFASSKIGLIGLIVVIVVLLLWLLRSLVRRGYTGRVVRKVKLGWLITIIVVIGYLVIAYHYYPWDQLEEIDERELKKISCRLEIPDDISDDVFKIIVRHECPAVVRMKLHQMIVWWGDTSKFKTGWYFKRNGATQDKFRVFQTRQGVDHVTIKIHRYHDPDPLWHTRQ